MVDLKETRLVLIIAHRSTAGLGVDRHVAVGSDSDDFALSGVSVEKLRMYGWG